jgi:hypothetical protein
MKKITLILFAALTLLMSSCGLDTYRGCPAYSTQNKITKHGQRAQAKFAKRHFGRKQVVI